MMRPVGLLWFSLSLLASASVQAEASSSAHHTHIAHVLSASSDGSSQQAPLGTESPTDTWNLAREPHANSTGQLIFDTVRSLLQRWPNTRYRNGHTLVPAIVPPGTLLYHGTPKNEVPSTPEWVATDPEHSLLFCPERTPEEAAENAPEHECGHLTLATTRNLKMLYFDGNSAAKMVGGPMDSQDLVGWGAIMDEKVWAEEERILALCEWASRVGIDGFVRMEMNFEMMICDFKAGIEVVSFLRLDSPKNGQRHINPAHPLREQASSHWHIPGTASSRVLEAGAWHNGHPGELRIVPDYTRVLTFYDADIAPDLAAARVGVPRLQHHIGAASGEDIKRAMDILEREVRQWATEVDGTGPRSGSGVDWRTLLHTITERYAGRLEALAHILSARTPGAAVRAVRQVRAMLSPYMSVDTAPPVGGDEAQKWAKGVYEHCATAHIVPAARLADRMTRGEVALLGAAQDVTHEICRVLVGVWAEGVESGVGSKDVGREHLRELAAKWEARVGGLMRWLDWSAYWLKCRPACGLLEICVLPTWPFLAEMPGRAGPPPEVEPDWVDPQPFCTRIAELEDEEEYR